MIKHLLDFTGGHNDIVEPDLIGDNQVVDSQNYEVLGQGGLTLRKEAEVYDATLNTYISTTLSITRLISISPPLYPQVKLASGGTTYQTNEFCIVVYGLVGGSPEMYLLYGITGGLSWSHLTVPVTGTDLLAGLTSAGVDWTTACKPEYSINNNRMVITDGVNKAYYIEVDSDGTVVSGTLGIPAPVARPVVIDFQISQRSRNADLSTAEGDRIIPNGLVHIVYTIVDKQGNESNPSPVSTTIDLQWNSLDVDFVQDKWVARIPVTNIALPTLSTVELEQVKYFRIYVRSVPYASDSYSGTLEFMQQFPAKTGIGTYILNLPVEPGNVVSYENDEAPIAHHNAQIGGVTFLGGTEETLEFGIGTPSYYVPITITNSGADYVDAIVRIRLYDTNSGAGDAISNLEWDNYITGGSINMPTLSDDLDTAALDKLRFIDQNLNTPLNTYMEGDSANDFVDAYVKIPYLPNGDHTIYLAWGTTAWVNAPLSVQYGRWTDSSTFIASARPYLWGDYTRTPSINTLIATPCNLTTYHLGLQIFMENRVNYDNSAPLAHAATENLKIDSSITYLNMLGKLGSTKENRSTANNPHVEMGSNVALSHGLKYTNNGLGAVPQSGIVYFNLYIPNLDTTADKSIFAMYNFADTDPLVMLYLDAAAGVKTWRVSIDGTDYAFGVREETSRGVSPAASGKPYFICFSWDSVAAKASLFIADSDNDLYTTAEISTAAIPTTDFTEGIISFGASEATTLIGAEDAAKYDEMVLITDEYYSAANTEDKDAVYSLASGMPPFASAIGYSKVGTSHNNNIDFGDVETTETTSYLNKIKWTEPNGVNFPDLYSKLLREPIKAMISSPSFLKFQYENTLVIMTRNTITRFLLDGEPSSWVGDPNSLVEEGFNAGIYAIDTLDKARDAMLWMTENGLIMWNSDGFRNISQNVIDITLRDEDDLVGFYQPIRDQYMLHDRTDDTTYVYHLRYGTFYKFSGLQLDFGVPRVLSGGTLDENVSLMIWGNGANPIVIYKYPGATDTTSTAYIVTKHYNHLRGVFKRFRFYFTGNPTIAPHVIDNTLDPTELMPNQADRDFTGGVTDWKDGDLVANGGAFDETGDLTITSGLAGTYCRLSDTSAPTTAGVEYTLQLDYAVLVAGVWIIKDNSNVVEYGRIDTAGTGQLLTFTAANAGGIRIYSGDATVSGSFDNFSLKTRDRNESKTPTSGVWNWITNGKNLGEKIFFKITGAKTILSGMYDYLIRGAR